MGCSGAIWLDVDGDGRGTAAYDYARRLFAESDKDLQKLIGVLANYDHAVATQAAHLYQTSGRSLLTSDTQETIGGASSSVRTGFREYIKAWRENQIARSEGSETTSRDRN